MFKKEYQISLGAIVLLCLSIALTTIGSWCLGLYFIGEGGNLVQGIVFLILGLIIYFVTTTKLIKEDKSDAHQ